MPRIIIYLGLALIVTAVGAWTWNNQRDGSSLETIASVFDPSSVRPFELTDHNGKDVTDKDFRGQLLLVFFGYTYCPDICPTGLTAMGETMDILGADADKVTPVFISIDPERDTPELLKDYVENFHPRLIGLTGASEQVAAAAKAYMASYFKIEDDDGDPETYHMGHTARMFLTGPRGEPLISFMRDTEPQAIAERIGKILERLARES